MQIFDIRYGLGSAVVMLQHVICELTIDCVFQSYFAHSQSIFSSFWTSSEKYYKIIIVHLQQFQARYYIIYLSVSKSKNKTNNCFLICSWTASEGTCQMYYLPLTMRRKDDFRGFCCRTKSFITLLWKWHCSSFIFMISKFNISFHMNAEPSIFYFLRNPRTYENTLI